MEKWEYTCVTARCETAGFIVKYVDGVELPKWKEQPGQVALHSNQHG
jgi:hypothetical protein